MKKAKNNIKKNLVTGVVALGVLGIFIIFLEFAITQLKKMWGGIYHLLPWQIQNKSLEFVVFIISTLLIIWLIGVIVNVTYLSNILLSRIPILGPIIRSFHGFQKTVTGFLKYKTVVLWEVPVINTIQYGVITKKSKIIKNLPDNKMEEQDRYTVYFPTVPVFFTGNVTKPDPKDLWIITNFTIPQVIRFFATAGADEPDVIISKPFLNHYPGCDVKLDA